jgi:hypothetical protein
MECGLTDTSSTRKQQIEIANRNIKIQRRAQNICWCIAFCLHYSQVLFLENKPSAKVFFSGII